MKNDILIVVLSFLMLSCGSAGTAVSPAATATNNSGSSAPAPGSASSAWTNFNFYANISGGSNSSYQAVSINTANKTITVSIPLPFDSTLGGIIMNEPLPSVPGATIKFGQLSDGTPVLTVTLPLSSIVKPVTTLPTSALPNGNALPGMPANSEPSEQIQIGRGKIPAYVYIGRMSVGLFVNTPFNPTIATRFQLTDNIGNFVGAIYSLPYTSSTQKDGGFFLSVNVPSQYTQLILNNL